MPTCDLWEEKNLLTQLQTKNNIIHALLPRSRFLPTFITGRTNQSKTVKNKVSC